MPPAQRPTPSSPCPSYRTEPTTPTPRSPLTPVTPLTPRTPTRPPSAHLARRKPVPSVDGASEFGALPPSPSPTSPTFQGPQRSPNRHTYSPPHSPILDLHFQNSSLPSLPSLAPAFQSRPHVLVVDPPLHDLLPSPAPSWASHLSSTSVQTYSSDTRLTGRAPPTPALAFGAEPNMDEPLPVYAVENRTEPKTLARWLWRWGWVFPPFWFIGMFILWTPLTYEHEGGDATADDKQTLGEMLEIVRRTEVRYAKRCAWGMAAWVACIVIIVVVVTAVVVSK